MKQKYLVISYDPDQQQWFYDVVFAESENSAQERIAKLRDYCIDFDVLDVPTLVRMTERVQTERESEAESWMQELEVEANKEE